MAFSFKKIFGRKDEAGTQGIQVVGTTSGGNLVVAKNVDWKQQGITDAGTAQGDPTAFNAGLRSCLACVRHSQELDKNLQQKMVQQLNSEKIALEGDLSAEMVNRDRDQSKLDTAKQKVDLMQRKLSDAQHGMVNQEKSVRLNFLIGVSIIALLTIYLFIFYSSTAYSAFFRDFDVSDSISEAMFDGNAVIDAFRSSFFEGCFCLFMPVIFLALGYVAHGFGTTTKGFERYLKTFLLYLITFAFDFLLAYKISKAFYNIEVVMSLTSMPPYSIKLALTNEDFWIVIFCGFVSYVIWGLVFSFIMSCYDKLTNNKYQLEAIRRDLDAAQNEVSNYQASLSSIMQKIAQIEAAIKEKDHAMQTRVRYDYNLIKQALADYFHGWTSYLALANHSTEQLQTLYNQEIEAVNQWISNKDK